MKEDLFVQKNPLQGVPGASRDDLFVQENPILNTPTQKPGESPTPGLEWDFKGMGMPDNFSIARKSIWFQLLIYTTYTGFIVGGAVLLWVLVMVAMAYQSRPSDGNDPYVAPADPTTAGVPQEDKNCMVLEGHPNTVTVIAFSPDGRTMISGGGWMGVTTPSATKNLTKPDPDNTEANVLRMGIGKPGSETPGGDPSLPDGETPDGTKEGHFSHGLDLTEIRKEAGLPPEEEEAETLLKTLAAPKEPAAPETPVAPEVPAEPETSGAPDGVQDADDISPSRSTSHTISTTMSTTSTTSETVVKTIMLPTNGATGETTSEAADKSAEETPAPPKNEDPSPAAPSHENAPVAAAENAPESPASGETQPTVVEPKSETEAGSGETPDATDETDDEGDEDDETLTDGAHEHAPKKNDDLEASILQLEPDNLIDGTGDVLGELEDEDPLKTMFEPKETQQQNTERMVMDNMAAASVAPPPGESDGGKDSHVTRPMDVLRLMHNNFRRLQAMMDHYDQEAKRKLLEKEAAPVSPDETLEMIEIAKETDDLQPLEAMLANPPQMPVMRPRDALELMANKFRRAMLIGNYMQETGKSWPPKPQFAESDEAKRTPPVDILPAPALRYITDVEPAPQYVANIHFQSYRKDETRRTVVEKPEPEQERREEMEIDVNELITGSKGSNTDSLQKTAEKIKAANAEHAEAAEKSGNSWENTSEKPAFPIVIWDLKTCRPSQIFWEHDFPITSITVSRAGNQFVSTDLGGNAILWKLVDDSENENASAAPVATLRSMEISRGGTSSEIKIMSLRRDGADMHSTTTAASETLQSPTLSESGQAATKPATARAKSRGPIWKMVGKITPTVRGEKGLGRVITFYGASFAPSGKQFVLCGQSIALDVSMNAYGETGMIMLWDIDSWSEVTRMHPISHQPNTWFQTLNPVGVYRSVSFTPDGKYLLAGASGFNAGVYWFQSGGEGQCMAVDADQPRKQRQVFTANMELESNLVSGNSGHEGPDAEQLHIAVSPDGNRVVSGDEYGRVNFWNFTPIFSRQDRGVFRLSAVDVKDAQTRHIRSVIYSRDKRFVMLVGEDSSFRNGRKRTFDYLGNLRIASTGMFRQMMYEVLCAQYSPDKQYLALGCDDHKIRVWKMDDIPLTSPTVLSSETKDGESPPTYDQTVESAKEVMTFKEDTSKDNDKLRKYNPDEINSRLPGENIQDPMGTRNRALESHNPLDKRLPRGSEEPIHLPL